jgi:probable F420-dependent oxidoreductase
VKIDAEVLAASPAEAGDLAKKAEEFGFDCLWANETKHDPFLQLALAAANTRSIRLGTSIALAFTRSPTALAYTAWDLQNLSGGRLILGLGSQVKGHIERRFGLKWESPTPKMREYIQALHSVWESWQTGSKLDFQGRFYKIDLMTQFFNPGPIGNPKIPIYVAGVNEGMCRLAGRLGDGLHIHPLHTVRYLKEAMLPAVSRGLERAGRRREEVTLAASVFAAVGDDETQISNVKQLYRSQIAFYASTRTYRKVMELHGWGDICDRLHQHSVKGKWDKMPEEIGEEVLGEFTIQGTWESIGEEVVKKYRGLVDRVRFYIPFDGSDGWRRLVGNFPRS